MSDKKKFWLKGFILFLISILPLSGSLYISAESTDFIDHVRQFTSVDYIYNPDWWTSSNNTRCLPFVKDMTGIHQGCDDAFSAYTKMANANAVTTIEEDTCVPPGAIVWYDRHINNGNSGHVGIATRDGNLVSVTCFGVLETPIRNYFPAELKGYTLITDYCSLGTPVDVKDEYKFNVCANPPQNSCIGAIHDSIQVNYYRGRTMCYNLPLYQGSSGPWTTPYDWDTQYREGDFRASYRIKNIGAKPILLEKLQLSVYNSQGELSRYMSAVGGSSPKFDLNINLEAGHEYEFVEAWASFTQGEIGEYRIVAEAFIGGQKYKLQNRDYLALDNDQVGMTLTVTDSPIILKTFLSSNQNVDGAWVLKAADNSGETGRFEAAYELHNITSAPVHISELTLATLKETIFHNMKIPGTDQYSITNIDIEPGGSFSFPPPSTPPASYSSSTVYPWEVLDKTANTNDFAYYNFSQNETGNYKVIPKITFNGQTYNMGYQDLKVINSQNITSIKITGWSVVSENSGAQYTCTAYHSDGSTTDVTGAAGWTLLGAINASLNNSGYLTTHEVSANDDCRIRASYGGMYDLFNVTIENSGSNLQAPYNLNASKGTYSDHIQISWSISANTDKVSIDRKKDDESWTGLGWTDTLTSHTDSDFLQTGSIYYYRVRAHNSTTGDVSVYSNEDSGFLKEPSADEKTPKNVHATNDDAHFIQLTCDWTAGINGWKVYRSQSPNGAYELINIYNNKENFIYHDYSPEPGIYYYYKLTSYGSFGESPPSSPVGGCKLLYFGGISPTNGSPGDTVTIINSVPPPGYPFGLGANQGTVYFGSTPAVVNSWNNNQISAIVPEGGGSVEVTVSSPAGILSSNSETFTYNQPPPLTFIEITGPANVMENSGAQYNCIAHYNDGTTGNINGFASWSVNSTYASINNSGYLSTLSIPSDQPCRISGTYTENGVTKSAYLDITIFLPTITVINPNGGERFEVGSAIIISWQTTGTVDNVKIEYSIDDGNTWLTEMGTIDNQESYEWTIPNTPSKKCLVRISDANDGIPTDQSNMAFSIVTKPTADAIQRVSISSDGMQGDTDSINPSISYDGRYVTFESQSTTLVPGDTNGIVDVFIYDRNDSTTRRISVANGGAQSNGDSSYASISGDGRFVAFRSYASNLISSDTNNVWDIFVHDCQTGNTSRVSVSSSGEQATNYSVNPSISLDGRFVAFFSLANNLVSGDGNGREDIFVHDRQTGQTTRVSVSSSGYQGNGASMAPTISADGRYVAFYSLATNLVPGDTNGKADVFIHDRQTGTTTRVSVASDGTQANGDSNFSPRISGDGRYVTFFSIADNLTSGDTNGTDDVFVYDRENGAIKCISINSEGVPGNGSSQHSFISGNGRCLGFQSDASNLVPGDINGKKDIFVYDLQTQEMKRVSVLTDGTEGNNDSYRPAITYDGRYLSFYSDAGNLVANDTNSKTDVFIKPLSTEPVQPFTLDVQSTLVNSVPIIVTPADINGSSNGNTSFRRIYNSCAFVTLTAPLMYNGKFFEKWVVNGKESWSQTIQITMYGDQLAVLHIGDTNPVNIDNDGDEYTENQGDCNDTNPEIHPGAPEACGDRKDSDCDGFDWVPNDIAHTEQKLTASDGKANNYFGHSVATFGDYIVVGSYGDNLNGTNSGSVYIYKNINNNFVEIQKLVPEDGLAFDRFGWSVDISGNRIIVGAPGSYGENTLGSVYIYEKNGDNWSKTIKLTQSDGAFGDFFGYSVSISGDQIVVGAPYHDNYFSTLEDSGAAYVYEIINNTWVETTKLKAQTVVLRQYFGISVSISNNRIVVGTVDKMAGYYCGCSYLFEKIGNIWERTFTFLTNESQIYLSSFHANVAIDNNYFVYGHTDNMCNVMKKRDEGYWRQVEMLSFDPNEYDLFEYTLDISGNYIVVGGSSTYQMGSYSAAYLYMIESDTKCRRLECLFPSDRKIGAQFGSAVTISDQFIVAGAKGDNENGENSGAVYLYKLKCDSPIPVDLALEQGSLISIPGNPAPGSEVTITVKALNPGATIDENIPVDFYLGDPDAGGTQIGEAIITGIFNSGDEKPASINWTIPETSEPLNIYSVIDPLAEYDTFNRANNKINGQLLKPDVTIDPVTWYRKSATTISVTARIQNIGALNSTPTNVKFRKDTNSGEILSEQSITAIERNNFLDVSFDWDITGMSPGEVVLVAIVDQENMIDEYDENNNENQVIVNIVYNTMSITAPNGGEQWYPGTTHDITWVTNMTTEMVNIEYSIDSGQNWELIDTVSAGIYSYPWIVSLPYGSQCLIRVIETYGYPWDISDGPFTADIPGGIPPTEREALINLYESTDGDHWTNNSGWKAPPLHTDGFAMPGTESIWTGITYDANNKTVISIALSNNNLVGTIPSKLTNLLNLNSLFLDRNKLIGNIPPELSDLTVIKTLHLYSNALTGNIPPTLINLTQLTDADIGFNGLYTSDDNLRSFLNSLDPDWENTQTIAPANVTAVALSTTSIQVSWTPIIYTESTGNYKVFYSTTPGGPYSYETTPTTDKTASSLTITGLLPGATYYFVVQTRTEPHTFNQNTVTGDYSSEISAATLPEIIINSPNGGENWEAGSIHPITWTSFGASPKVIIEYSINNGASWKNITPSTANDRLFNWQIPNTPSTNCLISISGSDSDKGPYDISNAVFSIIAPTSPTIIVQSPNGGEKLIVGSTKIIKWTTIGTVGDVKIEYSTDSGNSWTGIITSTSNSGSYPWTIPNTPSNSCLVRVSETDGEPMDTSDLEFSIEPPPPPVITVTSPNGGENLITGSTHEITWTANNSHWQVKLEYSTNNAASWETIIPFTPNDGSYTWTVPDTPSDNCLVRIRKYDADEGPSDTSDAVFSIKQGQFLKLTAPNGNEILEPGKNYLIKWESDPAIENIKLEYSPDNGSTYLPIADRIPNTASYEWPVPYHISANCLVRVSNTDGIRPSPQSLVYELKLKIQAANFPVTDNDIFTMWLGDLSKLNETVTHFTPKITMTRESNGACYIRMDETMKEIQPLSEGWRRLKVFLDMETQLASLWFDDMIIFENLPLKPGINFVPAVSFAVGAENPLAIEIDDLSLQLLTLTNGEDVFSTVFAEDFENIEEAKFPNNSGWKSTLNESRKKNRSTNPEKIEQSVFVYRDFATGVKCLKIHSIEDNQVIVVKPFNIPESYPFDISDKKFSIKSGESTKIE